MPFDIPDSWVWCRLNTACYYIHRGKTPNYGNEKLLPIIAQKCNQWSGIQTEKCLFAASSSIEKYTEDQYLQPNDIIINSTGGGTVGRTGFFSKQQFKKYKSYVADSHITIVRTNTAILSKYIYFFLISPTIQIGLEDRCSGSTNQIELKTQTIMNYLVPLPPTKEQEIIVAMIEKLFASINGGAKQLRR